MSRFRYREQKKRSQPGFTLIEMVVALAVAAVILVSTVALGRYIVVATADQSDQVLARLQVQYVSFWIGEDVVQATGDLGLSLGNTSVNGYKVEGFPIDMFLLDKDGFTYHNVEYSVEPMPAKEGTPGNTLMSLYRAEAPTVFPNTPKTVVAEYLDPLGTKCELQKVGNETYILVLKVTARVDLTEASGTYQINPRAYHGPNP